MEYAALARMAELVSLAKKQRKAIRSGDMEAVERLIDQKEVLVGKVMKLREKVDLFSDRGPLWKTEARPLIKSFLALEAECVALLSAERDEVNRKREMIQRGRKALHGYRPSGTTTPRFCDRQA